MPTGRVKKKVVYSQPDPNESSLENQKSATIWDLYILGITIVIGGQMFSWNEGLHAGFWACLLSLVLMAIGYFCLILCLSELTSALPFSGGVYGFVRVSLSPFYGFMVGSCEVIQNIMYVSSSVLALGRMVTAAVGWDAHFEPVVWIIFYASSLYINCAPGSVFLKVNLALGVLCLLIVLMYILIAPVHANFDRYVEAQEIEGRALLQYFPLSAWFYIGVETLPFAAVFVKKPKKEVPYAMLGCMATLFVLSVAMFFAASTQSPGDAALAEQLQPCSFAFAKTFDISLSSASWFTIPSTYATAFGFMFAFGRQMNSMANSGMLPLILRHRTRETGAPINALTCGSILSLLVVAIVNYTAKQYGQVLFYWCSMGSCVIYLSVFVTFVELRRKFGSLTRLFVNPFGIPSAILGMAIFVLNFVSLAALQGPSLEEEVRPIIGFVVMMLVAVLLYVCYAHHRQCFSVEEQNILYSAYMIKANRNTLIQQQRTQTILVRSFSGKEQSLFSNRSTDSGISKLLSSALHHADEEKQVGKFRERFKPITEANPKNCSFDTKDGDRSKPSEGGEDVTSRSFSNRNGGISQTADSADPDEVAVRDSTIENLRFIGQKLKEALPSFLLPIRRLKKDKGVIPVTATAEDHFYVSDVDEDADDLEALSTSMTPLKGLALHAELSESSFPT